MKPFTKNIIHQYFTICEAIVDEFVKTYLGRSVDVHNIGDEKDGVWNINDYFFSLSDMVDALELEVSEKDLFDWYYQWIDVNEKRKMNLKNFIRLGRKAK